MSQSSSQVFVGESSNINLYAYVGNDPLNRVDPSGKEGEPLRRPYICKSVRNEMEQNTPRTTDGRPIEPNTKQPIDGKPDLGHKTGNEFRTEKAAAQQEGLSQKEFNDRMNNSSKYQLEDPSSNRSHRFEAKGDVPLRPSQAPVEVPAARPAPVEIAPRVTPGPVGGAFMRSSNGQ